MGLKKDLENIFKPTWLSTCFHERSMIRENYIHFLLWLKFYIGQIFRILHWKENESISFFWSITIFLQLNYVCSESIRAQSDMVFQTQQETAMWIYFIRRQLIQLVDIVFMLDNLILFCLKQTFHDLQYSKICS